MGWNSATILTCPLQLNLVWCCEQEEWKARHLLRAFKDIPVFDNMKDLNKPAARDWRSGQFLPVQQVKGLWDGYPCTSISSCTGKPASFIDESSATGAGFHALLAYIDSNPALEWIVCENVRNMLFKQNINGTPIAPAMIQNEELKKRGFANCSKLVQSSNFGVPQSRTRCWIIYVKLIRLKALNSTMDLTFNQFECQPLSITAGISELKVLAVAVAELEEGQHNPWDEILVVQVDQHFGRNWCRSNPRLCPCVIPKGKYVLTHLWRFLTGQVSR